MQNLKQQKITKYLPTGAVNVVFEDVEGVDQPASSGDYKLVLTFKTTLTDPDGEERVFKMKHTVWTNPESHLETSTGKKTFINNQGKTMTATSKEEAVKQVWFLDEGVRPALKGETEILSLLAAMGRIDTNSLEPGSFFGIEEKYLQPVLSGDAITFKQLIKSVDEALGNEESITNNELSTFVIAKPPYVNIVGNREATFQVPGKSLRNYDKEKLEKAVAREVGKGAITPINGSFEWVDLSNPSASFSISNDHSEAVNAASEAIPDNVNAMMEGPDDI